MGIVLILGNCLNKLRVSGCSELKVNCRNSGPKQKLKKAKKAEVSFLPDIPEGKTQNVLEGERAAIVAEMKKKKVDWKKVTDMMASTFSLRRKEIVEQQPLVAEVKAKWPALFTDKQIEAEFARLTSSDLWDTFVSGLDQYLERFLQMYKAKSHCIQTLSSLLSLLDDDNSVQRKRAVILRGLPHFLREDPSKLLKTAETTESEEQMAKGVNIDILLIQEEEDVLDFSMVLEEQIVLNGIRPKVRIMGDSYICCGFERARETMGTNLGLNANLNWFGRGGMQWRALIPFFKEHLRGRAVPDVLLIHCGGNDLGHLRSLELVSALKQDLHVLH
ncbi:hypothetical protein MHYP_G00216730 [Metynnis hypsauchen]